MGTQVYPPKAAATPFQVSFRIAPEGLGVRYDIRNTTSKPIYLFNVLWEFDGQGNYKKAPVAAYVCLKGGRGLHVAQEVLPFPKTKLPGLRIVPFATKVDAGQSYSSTFVLPSPVKEYNAYFPESPDSTTEEVSAEAVIFTLQFVEELPGMTVKPSPIGEGLQIHSPHMLGQLQTVQSPPYHANIPALKRKDAFEDF
jgi:hypothetical protein